MKATPLLGQLLELRKDATALYKTSLRSNKGIPPTVQIEAPAVGTVNATTLTVLSEGGRGLWASLNIRDHQYVLTALRWQVQNKVFQKPVRLPKLPNGITRANRYGKPFFRVFVNKRGVHSVVYKYYTTLAAAVQCVQELES